MIESHYNKVLMKIFSIPSGLICIFILFLTLSLGCERPNSKYQYREVILESPLRAQTMPTTAMMAGPTLNLTWRVPKDWQEVKGEGMRLVSFKTNDNDPIECTIVLLGGMAGGLEANIMRWMKQINLTDVPEDQLSLFIEQPEEITNADGLTTQIFDFTKLQKEKEWTTPSMMAALMTVEGQSVFIKMTGTKSAVEKNLDPFKDLLQSIHNQ